MKQKLLLFIVSVTSVLLVNSQSIKGKVVDLLDNNPLRGGTVMLVSAKDTSQSKFTISDSTGRFQFAGLDYDTYYLMFTYSGYENYRQVVTINDSIPDVDLGN